MYFGPEVENSIVEYNTTDDLIHKTRLFNTIIYPALNKLAENVIHNKKFYNYGADEYANIKHDCVVHLHERLNKFDLEKGSKAFSYFNRVAINWVWANMKVVSDYEKTADLEEVDNMRNLDNEVFNADYLEELQDFCYKWSIWGNDNLHLLFSAKRDQKIANAIFNLFYNCQSIDIYNKKALYILIREQVNIKTQYITDVIKVLKPLFKEMYIEYQKNGTRKWKYYTIVDNGKDLEGIDPPLDDVIEENGFVFSFEEDVD